MPSKLTTMKTFIPIIKEAVIACFLFTVIAFTVNAIRSDGLPLIADKPYDIFVPCPETLGTVEMIAPTDPRLTDGTAFIVDAREESDFNTWHLKDAICITFDYLDPISSEEIKNIAQNIVSSGKAILIVYGDGDGEMGSTGYELGRELAGSGIQHVYVVKGGADALKGGSHE